VSTVPPNAEWRRVDRGKRNIRLWPGLVSRGTLLLALRALVLIVRVAQVIQKVFGDV
jgi:hypothetical protein